VFRQFPLFSSSADLLNVDFHDLHFFVLPRYFIAWC